MLKSVFISHCHEDSAFANELCDFLKEHGHNPWLDKREILPGQRWDEEIQKALRKADFIIIILSKTAVQKRGYIQREFKMALDYCQEKLDDDIYIIPVKIEDCDIPVKLSQFQWIEYSGKSSLNRILLALDTQNKKYYASKSTTNSTKRNESEKNEHKIIFPEEKSAKPRLMWVLFLCVGLILSGLLINTFANLSKNTHSDNVINTENRKISEIIRNYYSDLNNKTFDATQYFADTVERYISMLNTNARQINNYIIKGFYKEYVNFHAEMENGIDSITKSDNQITVYFIEQGSCFRNAIGKNWKYKCCVKAIFNTKNKIFFFRQYKIIKSDYSE